MKKLFKMSLLIILVWSMMGCQGGALNEEDVKQWVTDYKTAQYTIVTPSNPPTPFDIQEKVQAYLSAEELEDLMKSRIFSIAPTVAQNINKSILLEDVILEKETENDDGSIDYTYTLKLKFYDDQSSETIEKQGQLTIINDNGLKITRDWERITLFEKEAMLEEQG